MLLRVAGLQDLEAIAALCEASGRAPWTEEMVAPREERIVVVVIVDGELAGVAKTHRYAEADGEAPAGHYLGGVIVAPARRRGGVGSLLTTARLDWIWERADRAYYIANEHNTASISLHEALGFRPIARAPRIQSVTADDGHSSLVLFEAARPSLP